MGRKSFTIATGTVVLSSLVFACFSVALVAMPADAQRPENSQSARVGRLVAQEHCARCHAIGRRGQSPNPKAPRFPRIAFAGVLPLLPSNGRAFLSERPVE
jgi:cytochrome c553